jgi:hypothetical protein
MEVGMATYKAINIHRQIMDVSKQILIDVSFVSGGRLEGSKHNLKFQSTAWPQVLSQ